MLLCLSMFSISMFVEIPQSSPFSSLFIRGEQHPWQPWRAHLLYFIRVQPILINFFSPSLLLEAQTSALCAPLCLDQFAIRQNTVCGETGRGLWRRPAVLHVLSFTVSHRVETATSSPPHPPPPNVYACVALLESIGHLPSMVFFRWSRLHPLESVCSCTERKLHSFCCKTNGHFW